jgi:hypothetical protein
MVDKYKLFEVDGCIFFWENVEDFFLWLKIKLGKNNILFELRN